MTRSENPSSPLANMADGALRDRAINSPCIDHIWQASCWSYAARRPPPSSLTTGDRLSGCIMDDTIRADSPKARVDVYAGDVREYPALSESLRAFVAEHGRLDAVIHSAGRLHALGPTAHVDPLAWREDLEVSLVGAGHLAAAAGPYLELNTSGGAFVAFVGRSEVHCHGRLPCVPRRITSCRPAARCWRAGP